MLVSLVVHVTPEVESLAPHFLGREISAWFLAQVRDSGPGGPELAEELHGSRAYTASKVVGLGPGSRVGVAISPERPAWLRITSLKGDLSEWLLERIAPVLPGQTIELPGVPPEIKDAASVPGGERLWAKGITRLHINGVTCDPADHPWAGTDTYEDILERHTLNAKHPPRQVGLSFESPTAFKTQKHGTKMNIIFPLPELVFGNLTDRWNALSPTSLHPDTRRFAEVCVVVTHYEQLRSASVSFERSRRGAEKCFTGRCRYAIRGGDRYWTGLINLLADFAFYSGVGNRTSWGLGQTRLWHRRQPSY